MSVDQNAPSKAYGPWGLVLLALIVAEMTGVFELSSLTVAIPKLMTEFHVSTAEVSWVLTSFFLVSGAAAAIGGRLGDLFGRRRLLIAALLLSILGSLVSLTFDTFPAIIAGRAIQGFSGAVLPLVVGISREAVLPRRVPVTIAIVSGTATIAGAAGYLCAGLLIDHSTWHAIFVVAAALAGLAAVLAAVALRPSPVTYRKGERIDIFGGALFVPALALVLYAVTTSNSRGPGSPLVLGPLVGGLALGAFWVWWELRTPNPLISLRLLRQRKFALIMLVIALVCLSAIGGGPLLTPVLLQGPTSAPVGLGLTATAVGLLSLSTSGSTFLLSPLSGAISGRMGAQRSFVIGAVLTTVGTPGFFLFRTHLWLIVATLAVTAIGVAFVLTAIPNLIAEAVPAANTSEATGFYVVVKNTCASASITIASLILASDVVPGTQYTKVSAFGWTVVFLTLGAAASAGVALLIRGGGTAARDSSAEGHPLAGHTPALTSDPSSAG